VKTLGLLLALAQLPLGSPPVPQDPAPEEAPPAQPAMPSADALAKWGAIVAATSVPGERAPITAFDLSAEVRASQGVQTNQLVVHYRYLAPDYIRFAIGAGRETGRGPGKGTAAYWLRDGERVTVLNTRDYKQDRDLVRRMTTIAQNVVALSDPARLTIQNLELREIQPPFLPQSLAFTAKRLHWIEFQSPDFDLYKDEPAPGPGEPADQGADPTADPKSTPPKRLFRVLIGADRKTHHPVLVALREEGEPGRVLGEPLLFELRDLRAVNGYYLPHTIFVRGLEPDRLPPVFQAEPAQEIGVRGANLAPELKPDDFRP
jgi:hypothetical protein